MESSDMYEVASHCAPPVTGESQRSKSAPHFSSDRVEGDIIPTPEAIITMNTRILMSIRMGVAINPLQGMKKDKERVPLLFFLYVGFFFFCERAVELFFEIFGLWASSSGVSEAFISSIVSRNFWIFFLFFP